MATENPSLFPIVPPKEIYNRLPLNSLVPSGWNDVKNAKFQPRNKMLWSLYVRALLRMQNRDPSKDDSYFQIAGTHAYPFVEWAKSHRSLDDKFKPYGYCAHSQVLFPTWHRIATLAFEQILLKDALDIAKDYDPPTYQGVKWTDVANELRLPYWDWAVDMGRPPPELFGGERASVCSDEGEITGYEVTKLGDNVKIISDDGTETEVLNPLLRYKFPEIYINELANPDENLDKDLKDKFIKFSRWPTTVRNPDINSNEDIAGMLEKFKRVADEISMKTLMMFQSANSMWEYFSNHGMRSGQVDLHNNSIEAIHDDIHVLSGGGHSLDGDYVGAHMSDLVFAGFDPLFWLHHTNVDRLLSLWQVLNPDIWVSPGQTLEPSRGWEPGQVVDENTGMDSARDDLWSHSDYCPEALDPFYQGSGKPWTSVLLRDIHELGYSYPDLSQEGAATFYGRKENPASSIPKMLEHVKQLYGYSPNPNENNPAVKVFAEFFDNRHQISKDFEMYNWGIHACFKKYEVKDSFSLVFYFADGVNWDDDGYYIGSINAFRGLTPETCSNCKAKQDIYQQGYVPLTYLLARSIEWDTTHNPSITRRTEKDFSEPAKVLKYLKDRKLTCRIDGVGTSQLKSLEIHLYSELLNHATMGDSDAGGTAQPLVVAESGRRYIIERDWTKFRINVIENLTGISDVPEFTRV